LVFEATILAPDMLQSQSVAHWVGTQDQVKLTKNLEKHAPIMMLPKENPKQIFFNLRRIAKSIGGFRAQSESTGEL